MTARPSSGQTPAKRLSVNTPAGVFTVLLPSERIRPSRKHLPSGGRSLNVLGTKLASARSVITHEFASIDAPDRQWEGVNTFIIHAGCSDARSLA